MVLIEVRRTLERVQSIKVYVLKKLKLCTYKCTVIVEQIKKNGCHDLRNQKLT